jgi:hypothetical protein
VAIAAIENEGKGLGFYLIGSKRLKLCDSSKILPPTLKV